MAEAEVQNTDEQATRINELERRVQALESALLQLMPRLNVEELDVTSEANVSGTLSADDVDVRGTLAAAEVVEGGTALEDKYQPRGKYQPAGDYQPKGDYLKRTGGTVSGDLTVKGVIKGKVSGGGETVIASHDLRFGHGSRGSKDGRHPDKTTGRALVDRDSRLIINFHSDWPEGTWVHGNLEVQTKIKCKKLCETSSLTLKQDVEPLTTAQAHALFADLEPVTFAYRDTPTRRHSGFIAEYLPDLVTDTEHTAVFPTDILAILTRIVKQQQREIEELRDQLPSSPERISR